MSSQGPKTVLSNDSELICDTLDTVACVAQVTASCSVFPITSELILAANGVRHMYNALTTEDPEGLGHLAVDIAGLAITAGSNFTNSPLFSQRLKTGPFVEPFACVGMPLVRCISRIPCTETEVPPSIEAAAAASSSETVPPSQATSPYAPYDPRAHGVTLTPDQAPTRQGGNVLRHRG